MQSLRTFNRWLTAALIAVGGLVLPALAQSPRALVNLSLRTEVANDRAAVISFHIEGSAPKPVLIRAVGPTLRLFGLMNALEDTQLTVHDGSGAAVAGNDDWGGDPAVLNAFFAAGAFPLDPTSKDSALLLTLPPGTYSARAIGAGGSSGNVLLEVYDTSPEPRLAYLGGQAMVTQATPLVTGFMVNAPAPQTFLIRAIGPALQDVAALSDPVLNLFYGFGWTSATNDNWGNAASQPALVGAAEIAGLRPLADYSGDAAMLIALPSGAVSMNVYGKAGASGMVVYEVAQIDGDRAPSFAPALAVPPTAVEVPAGAAFSLSAVALGRPYPSFQWYKNGTAIPGATEASLSFAEAQATDASQYSVTLTNSAGVITSVPWTVTLAPPTPFVITLNHGESFDFLTETKSMNPGSGDLSFDGILGQFDAHHPGQRGMLSLGATTTPLSQVIPPFSNYHRAATPAIVGHTYVSWLRTGSVGQFAAFKVLAVTPVSVKLQYAAITSVDQPLSIRMQPSSFYASYPLVEGSVVQLDVGAIAAGPLSYQWRKEGVAIPGATQASLLLTNASWKDNGFYDVVVTVGSESVTSYSAFVNIPAPIVPPTIIGHPLPVTAMVGGFASFGAAINGTTPWSFQWRKDGVPIPGATAPFYFVVPVSMADAGIYDVVVSNIAGSATSNGALLTVLKARAIVELGDLVQPYDGSAKAVAVTTTPAGLSVEVTYNGSSNVPTAVGSYDVVATVTDANYEGSATGTLEIRDVTAPVIRSVEATPDVIAVPNHKMVPVSLHVAVTDDADPQPVTRIVSVTCNEPANGPGDGNTAVDWEITGDLTLNVRAERSGAGSGRIYTVVVESRDASGNVSTASTTVSVPKGNG